MHQAEPSSTPELRYGDVWSQLLRRVHAELDLEVVAATIVNDGRTLADCDRLILLMPRRRGWQVVATTGQERFDRRSNVVRAWETFAAVAAPLGEPISFDGAATRQAPEVEAALAHLVDVTGAKQLVFVPLVGETPNSERPDSHTDRAGALPTGWLAAERFQGAGSLDDLLRRTELIAGISASAVAHAERYRRLPLRKLGEAIDRRLERRRLTRTAAVALVAALIVAALFLIPTQLKIEARGTLQPADRRHVFAPAEGIVVALDAKHGQHVEAGRQLLEMKRPELDFELTRVDGELLTQQRRLSSLQAARLRGARSENADSPELLRLTADEEEARQQVAGLKSQQEELQRQRTALKVTAPLGGEILTWDVQRTLEGRPVLKGQQLLTVGDVAGPWELDLTVADEYAGYVRGAETTGEPVEVEFVAASSSGETHRARISTIAARSDFDDEGRSTVAMTASLDADVPRDVLRPGTAVTAKVACGSVSIGYAWTLELVHFFRTKVWF
jgi:multidrug efflux pump subunit AcrA (membrane-fusion protein)